MTARQILRWLLVVQALVALMLAFAMLHVGVVQSPWLALVAALATVLLVRLAICANNFVMSARFASPTPPHCRIGPGAGLRMLAEEFRATMLHSSWFMARAKQRTTIHAGSTHPPVLLLHGYGCNSGYWTHLTPLLDAQRISHATLDLEPILGSMESYLPMVQHAVDALCVKTNATQVVMVAHSMGGLVARAWLRTYGSAKVVRIFTLGTPHHGTCLAGFGPGANAAQMRCMPVGVARGADATFKGSPWLQDLAASESDQTRALITSFYTHHDNIVSPQTSSFLPGAHNVEFGGIGHVAMGRNPRVLARLMQELVSMSAH